MASRGLALAALCFALCCYVLCALALTPPARCSPGDRLFQAGRATLLRDARLYLRLDGRRLEGAPPPFERAASTGHALPHHAHAHTRVRAHTTCAMHMRDAHAHAHAHAHAQVEGVRPLPSIESVVTNGGCVSYPIATEPSDHTMIWADLSLE